MILIFCAGGNRRFASIAVSEGWKYGARLPSTVHEKMFFADQDWKRPNRTRYMDALEKYRPIMATVLDFEDVCQYPEILSWAEQASQWCEKIVIIPKVSGTIDDIPQKIGTSDIILGYSVPTSYGGTSVPVWEFGHRPVHLLGGSPQKQRDMTSYLNVVSADGNMAIKCATKFLKYWTPQGWVSLVRGERDAPYRAFEYSMREIMEFWQKR